MNQKGITMHVLPFQKLCTVAILLIFASSACDLSEELTADDSRYLSAVQTFANNILTHGRDTYGETHSPLFVDGINVHTSEPIRWELDGESWVLSNFASQQNFVRVLTSLTELTGEQNYRKAAVDAAQYMFDHQSDSQGLLYWGGHQFVDLETMQNQFDGRPHELKNNFPYYEFLWEVDSLATRNMLRAMWNAHIMDWTVLDMNRHGPYDSEMGPLWDHEFEQQEPFFEGRGLTFINFGTDMMHVGFALYFLGEEEGARVWSMRLFDQYVQARHPETGLGVYQYSRPERREAPPAEGPLTGRLTYSNFGDRAENQFGAVYGDIALEGNVLWGNRVRTLYGRSPIVTLYLAEQMQGTDEGAYLLDKTLAGMKAIAEYAYVPEDNYFKPMWANGTDLSGHTMQRTGYYGKEGREFSALTPGGVMALSYARAARLSDGNSIIWNVVSNILKANGLGFAGANHNDAPELNLETDQSDPDFLIAVLELYQLTGERDYLKLAERIGDNILATRFHHGYFMPTEEREFARFDEAEPLALLTLEAVRQGRPNAVPTYLAGIGSTQGDHDEYGRTRDFIFYR